MFLFVPIFHGANKSASFRSNFYMEQKDLFQFDIETNLKKQIEDGRFTSQRGQQATR
jgi:hypothetical protein